MGESMRNIRIAAAAAAVWLGTGGIALAQAFNWTGFYVGANAGWLSGNISDGFFTDTPSTLFSPGRNDHGAAGFFGGYQLQSGNWVIGAEAGFNAALDSDYSKKAIGPDCNIGTGNYTCDGRVNNFFTAGGRLGWAFERWVVYGVGGYARGLVQTSVLSAGGPRNMASGYADGWYAGGGIDYALYRNIFLGVEYRHYDLGDVIQGGDVFSDRRQLSVTADSVMARLTIKLAP
jgi:outer membrane immunogenic protein